MSIIIVTNDPRIEEFLDELVTLDYSGEEMDDYWCIQITPFNCESCGKPICFASAGPHFIIVWAERDDETILQTAAELKEGNYEPIIVRYNRIIGPCVKFEDALKHGWIESISH